MPEEQKAPERTFDLTFTETELNFLANASFQVNIEAKYAKVVSDLQTRLISTLTTPPGPAPTPSE